MWKNSQIRPLALRHLQSRKHKAAIITLKLQFARLLFPQATRALRHETRSIRQLGQLRTARKDRRGQAPIANASIDDQAWICRTREKRSALPLALGRTPFVFGVPEGRWHLVAQLLCRMLVRRRNRFLGAMD